MPGDDSTTDDDNDNDDDSASLLSPSSKTTTTAAEEEEGNILDKINKFLDTPILDANNRSNQGAVAETLKGFVRDEPEIAQVAFSIVVVAAMALGLKVIL